VYRRRLGVRDSRPAVPAVTRSYDERQRDAVLVNCANPECRRSFYMVVAHVFCANCCDPYRLELVRVTDVNGVMMYGE